MPWKECSVVEERLRFVARLLDGEAMTELCREFGISRKTGYKIFDRYKEHGLEALSDRRPVCDEARAMLVACRSTSPQGC
jgi:transposase